MPITHEIYLSLTKASVGLGNVDNTSDADKPISTLTAAALSGKQATLVSGTSIKTINGISLLGAGDIAISSGLTVGSTSISSGTSTRLLFQSGSVLSQSSNLTYDGSTLTVGNAIKVKSTGLYPIITLENVSGHTAQIQMYYNQLYFNTGASSSVLDNVGLSLGFGGTGASARLDIKSAGALSTDMALRIRNSANTANLAQFNGDGTFRIGDANGGLNSSISLITDGRLFLSKSGANFIELNPGTTANRLYGGANGWEISGSAKTMISTTGINAYFFDGTLQIASGLNVSDGATYTMHMENGTAPTTSVANQFKMYSKDIVAGNAAPHFRTEAGDIIKLYKQSAAGVTTVSDVVTVLTNLGLLA